MKKYTLLLLSGSILTLAACGGGNENTDTQAQIDSAANARSAAMEAQLKAKNDSLINAMAMMKADSAMRATTPVTASANTPAAPSRTTSSSSRNTKPSSQHTNSGTNTTSESNNTNTDTPSSTITKEQQQQQNNKFNER